MSSKLYEDGDVSLTRYCGPAVSEGSRIRYQLTREGPVMMAGEDFVTVSQKDAIQIALRILRDAFEKRGLSCRIVDCHPFEILNSIGGLLGHNPAFDPAQKAD